ncbi:probable tesA-like protease [Vibrio variabilis]|uniref:Probable tesA-like protease n=1 Tax=Vibrio variabilis TaxID=990271 RepID=A0ABQ0JD51_9VIBR|nr:probable tesA-like protease [Vibrio variabilis]
MKKVALLGDSLTAGWGLPQGENWSCKLAKELSDIEFINRGVPGDTTTGMLSRFKLQVIDAKPDAFVLFGGLNDLNWGTDISVVASNLNSMIAQAQHHNIKPILIITSAVDPIGSLPMFGNNTETVETLRHSIKTLSSQHSEKLKAMYGHGPYNLTLSMLLSPLKNTRQVMVMPNFIKVMASTSHLVVRISSWKKYALYSYRTIKLKAPSYISQ